MHSYKRSDRVAELIQKTITDIIRDFKEPGLGFVTVTGVKVTTDLLDARIFYSVIGTPEVVEKSTEILEKSLKTIRHELAVRLNLRRTPELTLKYDDTSEKANRIFELLEKIQREEPPPHHEEENIEKENK
jgi:ribosome-binding factor A